MQYESIESAASRLGVNPRTVRRRISDGSLRAYRVGPRVIRLVRDDVDDLLRPIPAAGRAAC